jgi:hypothetical protein
MVYAVSNSTCVDTLAIAANYLQCVVCTKHELLIFANYCYKLFSDVRQICGQTHLQVFASSTKTR